MAKFTNFVSDMHTRTVKYPQKQPTKRKVWLFEVGSVTKILPPIHMPELAKVTFLGREKVDVLPFINVGLRYCKHIEIVCDLSNKASVLDSAANADQPYR